MNLTTDCRRVSTAPVSRPTPVRRVSPSKSLKRGEFPLKEVKSLDGIISYLTRKHGGNVHGKGIVAITSKSVFNDDSWCALRNVADLISDSVFRSKCEPGQWGFSGENGLVEFKIGNLPPKDFCELEVQCGFVSSAASPDTLFFKFPLDTFVPLPGLEILPIFTS
jgi:hypothetical protein